MVGNTFENVCGRLDKNELENSAARSLIIRARSGCKEY